MSDEELEFNVGDNEQPATVVVSPGDENQPASAEVVENDTHETEINQYSANVKKRIDKLTARLRETERREQAAIEYAQKVQNHAQQLEQKYRQTGDQLLGEAQNRIGTQLVALKQIIKKAREEGDIDTETEAQERLTSIMLDQQRISQAAMQREAAMAHRQAAQQNQMAQAALNASRLVPSQVAQQVPSIDPKAEEWAEKNPWFGSDITMTHAARGVHEELVKKEGFDPTSDEYYDEIDKRMRTMFPQKFSNSRGSRPVQTVAPATRSSGATNARRTVRLSPSQVAIAKKLGVPLEEYAKYVKE